MTIRFLPSFQRALLALVAAAFLCAQWVGPRHRVEHGDRFGALALLLHQGQAILPSAQERGGATDARTGQATSPRDTARWPQSATWHDCAAFDAAALGDGPPQAIPACAPPPASAAPAAARVSPAGAAPQALGYSSRAPPRA